MAWPKFNKIQSQNPTSTIWKVRNNVVQMISILWKKKEYINSLIIRNILTKRYVYFFENTKEKKISSYNVLCSFASMILFHFVEQLWFPLSLYNNPLCMENPIEFEFNGIAYSKCGKLWNRICIPFITYIYLKATLIYSIYFIFPMGQTLWKK